MLKIKNKLLDIPGGWKIRIAETSCMISGSTFSGLINNVLEHLEINGYDAPDNLVEQIEHQIALRLPVNRIEETDERIRSDE